MDIRKILPLVFLSLLCVNLAFATGQGGGGEGLAKRLYCETYDVLTGDIGLLIGLIVGVVGFLTILFKDAAFSGFVMLGAGVFITALPAFFESTLQNITTMAGGMGAKAFNMSGEGRSQFGSCDSIAVDVENFETTGVGGLTGGGANGGFSDVGLPTDREKMILRTLKVEGGFNNCNVNDSGGCTNLGITQKTLAAYRGHPVTKQDVINLSRAEAINIYRKNYMGLSDQMPDKVRYMVYDASVHHGPGGAKTILKNALSTMGVSTSGGVVHATRNANSAQLQQAYLNARADYMNNIMTRRPKDRTHVNGWANRLRGQGWEGKLKYE